MDALRALAVRLKMADSDLRRLARELVERVGGDAALDLEPIE